MRILISICAEDNLTSLKNLAPNFDFTTYAGNPIIHARRYRMLNTQFNGRVKRSKKCTKKKRIIDRSLPDLQPTAVKQVPYLLPSDKSNTNDI